MKKKKKKKLSKQERFEKFNARSFVRKTLRGAFRNTEMYNLAKDKAKNEYFIPSKTGKPMRRVNYVCPLCKRKFTGKDGDMAVDHVVPIISNEWGTFNEWLIMFVRGLYCLDENDKPMLDNLMYICNYKDEDKDKYGGVLSCHSQKTKRERGKNND